jgi:hypothetical protein
MTLAAIMMTIVAFVATISVMKNLNEKFEEDPEANEDSVSLMAVLSTISIYFLSNMATLLLYKIILE